MSTVQLTEDQTYVFKPSDFTSNTAALKGVQISALPTTGTLQLNGAPVTLNQIIVSSDISAGHFAFVPKTDVTAAESFSINVGTSSSTGSLVITPTTMTTNVTADAGPSAQASSITATENQTYTFKTADFGYSDSADATSDPLKSVTITSLPSDGTLQLSGVAVTANQVVSASDISAGHLTFVPNTNVTTAGSFNFKVTDSLGGTTSAAAATMSVNISGSTPTDTGPSALASSVAVTEDVTYVFKASDFGYSDSFDPADPIASVTISSLPTTGTLKLSGAAVTVGQVITAANIPNLAFVPNTDVTTQGSFTFKVTDTTGGITSASAATMTLKVTADAGPSA